MQHQTLLCAKISLHGGFSAPMTIAAPRSSSVPCITMLPNQGMQRKPGNPGVHQRHETRERVLLRSNSVSSTTASTAQAILHMQVLNIVAERMPQILKMGVPVPDHVPFYMDNVIPEDHDRQINNETQLSKQHCNLCEQSFQHIHAWVASTCPATLCWACPA